MTVPSRSLFSNVLHRARLAKRRSVSWVRSLPWLLPHGCIVGHSFTEDFLVSSEKGLYVFSGNRYRCVYHGWVYGIALVNDKIYMSCAEDDRTIIVAADMCKTRDGYRVGNIQEIYGYSVADSGNRIHQIAAFEDKLYIANTGKNGVTILSLTDHTVCADIPLFYDECGVAIQHDHNHLNSVLPGKDFIVFVAYKVGGRSCIGLITDAEIYYFAYQNKGVHDCVIMKDSLLFSDTFGADQKGYVIKNGMRFCEDYFSEGDGYIVRGLLQNADEFLIGHSHKGKRQKRFQGKGKILVAHNEQVIQEVDLPFAQLYDMRALSNKSCRKSAVQDIDAKCVLSLLREYLGEPMMHRERKSHA